MPAVATIIALKLAVMPAAVYGLAQFAFGLPPQDVLLLTVLAAMIVLNRMDGNHWSNL